MRLATRNFKLTLSLPVMRICVNYSTVYNDTLVVKGLTVVHKINFSHSIILLKLLSEWNTISAIIIEIFSSNKY